MQGPSYSSPCSNHIKSESQSKSIEACICYFTSFVVYNNASQMKGLNYQKSMQKIGCGFTVICPLTAAQ